jgi:hypothetical protein
MKNTESVKLANIKMLEFIAAKLGNLCNEVVFLGGCTTALFITDLASPDVRYTLDVDCIVDVISLTQYYCLEKKLSKLGFKKSLTESVICRWFYDDTILDVMPTDKRILGFGNQWYKGAIQYAKIFPLTDKLTIQLVTAPYFLATKLEAFIARGNMDFYASHDFEDIISVLDGRLEMIDEIKLSDKDLRSYLAQSFMAIESRRSFHDALPGHFAQYGNLAEDRIDLLLQKIKIITEEVSEV